MLTCCCPGVRPPTAQQAHDLLVSALQDQAGWEARAVAAKELLNQMVKSRREATLLSQSYDIKCAFGRLCQAIRWLVLFAVVGLSLCIQYLTICA